MSRRRPGPSGRRRRPGWTWLLLGLVAIAAAWVALDAREGRRAARLRAELPAPDLAAVEPRVAAAIAAAQGAVRAAPASAEAWGALGATFDVHGLYDAAATCYARAQALDGADFRWPYLRAIVRDVSGADRAEVERLFRDALALRDDYAPAWFRLGHALSLRGDQAGAREALERALALDQALAPAQRELGQVLLALADDPAALAALGRAVELQPDDGSVWATLAQALARAGRADDAQQAAERARQLAPVTALRDPVHGQFVAARGVSTLQLLERAGARVAGGDFRGALETLAPLLAETPGDAQAAYLAGTAHARLGDVAAARVRLDAALGLDATHVGALLESGALLEGEGRTLEALALYRRAFDHTPRDAQVLASLARAHALSGDDRGAVQAFERLAELTPLDARTLMNWGNALNRLGRSDEAIARLSAALRLQPDFAHAHYNLAVALEDGGRRDEAIPHYREAGRLDPTLPVAAALARLGVTP